MDTKNKGKSTYDKQDKSNLRFFFRFNKDGESFQSIMEKILINKINKNEKNYWKKAFWEL